MPTNRLQFIFIFIAVEKLKIKIIIIIIKVHIEILDFTEFMFSGNDDNFQIQPSSYILSADLIYKLKY